MTDSVDSPDRERFLLALERSISNLGIEQFTGGQLDLLAEHYSMIRRWNRRLNLTRIIEPDEAAQLHYADSLYGVRFLDGARTLLDIGSGAGFPGVPLAVAMPDLQVTALEADVRKSLFLMEVKDTLGLANLTVARARVEEFDINRYQVLATRALDQAEAAVPAVIARLQQEQKLLLYTGIDVARRLGTKEARVQIHAVPQSERRVVAIFSLEA